WGLGVKALRLRDQGLAPEELGVLGLLAGRPATLEAFYAALAGGSVSGGPSGGDPPRLRRERAPYLFDWLDHPGDDDYWQSINIERNAGRVTVPAFNSGGWYDIFQEGPARAYAAMRAGAASEAARGGQRLIMGAWH